MTIKYLTIKNPKEFKLSPLNCKKSHTNSLTIIAGITPPIYYQNKSVDQNLLNFCRVGITVSKQISKKSSTRNLIKRRIRGVLKHILPNYGLDKYDYIIIAKKNIVEVSFENIYNEVKYSFKKISKS